MKNKGLKVLCLLLVIVLAVGLAGCGNMSKAAGVYEIYGFMYTGENVEGNGRRIYRDEMAYWSVAKDIDSIALSLNRDGTGLLRVDGESYDITWNNKEIWLTEYPETRSVYYYKDGYFRFDTIKVWDGYSFSDCRIVFKK